MVLFHRPSLAQPDRVCSSDACETFDSYEALVEHIESIQKIDSDSDLTTVCMCQHVFQDDLCRGSDGLVNRNLDLDGPTMRIWRNDRAIALLCAALDEGCFWDCPNTSIRVETGASLSMIGVGKNFQLTNTAGNFPVPNSTQFEPTSKIVVEPGGFLFVSEVEFVDIASSKASASGEPPYGAVEGGAIATAGKTTILDSTFVNCFAGARGGAIASTGSELDIRRTTFVGNKAPVGGAVYISSGADTTETDVRIYASTFSGSLLSEFDDGILDEAALANNLERDSDVKDSVFVEPETTGIPLEFCDNDGLEDNGCGGETGGNGSFARSVLDVRSLWMVLSLVSLGSAVFV